MEIEELRSSQILAGMKLDPDPRKHLEARQKDGLPLPRNTMLPPSEGLEEPYVCMVHQNSPHSNYTILGIDFCSSRYENVHIGDGIPPEKRAIYHVYKLAPNQVDALKIEIGRRFDEGYTGRLIGQDGEKLPERVGKTPLAKFLRFEKSYAGVDGQQQVDAMLSENQKLVAEVEKMRRERDEAIAMAKATVPKPAAR